MIEPCWSERIAEGNIFRPKQGSDVRVVSLRQNHDDFHEASGLKMIKVQIFCQKFNLSFRVDEFGFSDPITAPR